MRRFHRWLVIVAAVLTAVNVVFIVRDIDRHREWYALWGITTITWLWVGVWFIGSQIAKHFPTPAQHEVR